MRAPNASLSVEHVCVFCKVALRQQRLRPSSRSISSSATKNDHIPSPSPNSSSNIDRIATVPYGSFFKKPSASSAAFTLDPSGISSRAASQNYNPPHLQHQSKPDLNSSSDRSSIKPSSLSGEPTRKWVSSSSSRPPRTSAEFHRDPQRNSVANSHTYARQAKLYGASRKVSSVDNPILNRSSIPPRPFGDGDNLPSWSGVRGKMNHLKGLEFRGAGGGNGQTSQSGIARNSKTRHAPLESSKPDDSGLQALLQLSTKGKNETQKERNFGISPRVQRTNNFSRSPRHTYGSRSSEKPNGPPRNRIQHPFGSKDHENYQARPTRLHPHVNGEAGRLNGNNPFQSQVLDQPQQARTVKERQSKLSLLLERMGDENNPGRESGKGRIKGRSRAGKRNGNDDNARSFVDEDNRAKRRAFHKAKRARLAQEAAAAAASRRPQISLPQHISVANLATLLDVRYDQFVQQMEELGFSETAHDHVLALEDANLIAMEYGLDPVPLESADDIFAAKLPEDMSTLPERPPVVTIMGHVDHGKTTLLDFLRKSSIAAGEHGGITQHIGAFSVQLSSGKAITFLDTPGHAAFLTMRQRGANVTDIVVLVVAADDGVMPQTIEAIKHAKAAKVPIIVAINKIDKSDANAERAKQDLARHGIEIEDFGGDTQVICVSGKTGLGMDKLEEAIITLSEILDHRAPIDGPVEGWLLEAATKIRGRVATVLVRRGCLKPGNIIVAGRTWARVKTLRNEAGVLVDSASPGIAVEVDGWKGQPVPGDEVLEALDEQKAAAVTRTREAVAESVKLAQDMKVINESRRHQREIEELKANEEKEAENYHERRVEGSFQANKASSGMREVFFVVKADVVGSVEAVVNMISGLGNADVRPHIIRSGVGDVNEGDVELAASAGGHILSFNAEAVPSIRGRAGQEGVEIIEHSIIYRVAEDVNKLLEDALPPLVTQRVTGEAEIAELFSITLPGKVKLMVAGCKVRNGLVKKGGRVRVLRRGKVVHDGSISSLKNVKKEVTEMKKDTECGMSFDGWAEFEVGDQVQCYTETTTKRTL